MKTTLLISGELENQFIVYAVINSSKSSFQLGQLTSLEKEMKRYHNR